MQNLFHRPRRLRQHPVLRDMVQENHLRSSDLIMPIFIIEGNDIKEEIDTMPGQFRYSLDRALEAISDWAVDIEKKKSGVGGFILFGIPTEKDARGSSALDPGGVIPRAVKSIKSQFPHLLIITDLCFCEYTNHGHCGIIDERGELDNDATLKILGDQAVIHAQAGTDFVAPSGMVDGMVGSIRQALDGEGFTGTGIISYAVKYASAFYGPFRSAVKSFPGFGDRRGYQMNPPNRDEAIREAELDIAQGADILMVKPGMPYLDIVRDLRQFSLPLAVYQVSGEYTMFKWASEKGNRAEREMVIESLLSMKRAGASLIITYFAAEIAADLTW